MVLPGQGMLSVTYSEHGYVLCGQEDGQGCPWPKIFGATGAAQCTHQACTRPGFNLQHHRNMQHNCKGFASILGAGKLKIMLLCQGQVGLSAHLTSKLLQAALLYVYGCFVCMHVLVPLMCLVPQRSGKGIWFPGTGVELQVAVSRHVCAGNQERPALVTTEEPSSQSLNRKWLHSSYQFLKKKK